jgi:hypothetical protein
MGHNHCEQIHNGGNDGESCRGCESVAGETDEQDGTRYAPAAGEGFSLKPDERTPW